MRSFFSFFFSFQFRSCFLVVGLKVLCVFGTKNEIAFCNNLTLYVISLCWLFSVLFLLRLFQFLWCMTAARWYDIRVCTCIRGCMSLGHTRTNACLQTVTMDRTTRLFVCLNEKMVIWYERNIGLFQLVQMWMSAFLLVLRVKPALGHEVVSIGSDTFGARKKGHHLVIGHQYHRTPWLTATSRHLSYWLAVFVIHYSSLLRSSRLSYLFIYFNYDGCAPCAHA